MSVKSTTQAKQVTLHNGDPMLPLPSVCIAPNQVTTHIINADCAIALKTLPMASVDLVMTSPPYANQRKHTYGGVRADQYVEWFLPIADELYRVLKPRGSFVLNILCGAPHNIFYVEQIIMWSTLRKVETLPIRISLIRILTLHNKFQLSIMPLS